MLKRIPLFFCFIFAVAGMRQAQSTAVPTPADSATITMTPTPTPTPTATWITSPGCAVTHVQTRLDNGTSEKVMYVSNVDLNNPEPVSWIYPGFDDSSWQNSVIWVIYSLLTDPNPPAPSSWDANGTSNPTDKILVRKTITLPANASNINCTMNLEEDDNARVWLNGNLIVNDPLQIGPMSHQGVLLNLHPNSNALALQVISPQPSHIDYNFVIYLQYDVSNCAGTTITPSISSTPTPTSTPTNTATPTPTATMTSSPSSTSTLSPSPTSTNTSSNTPTGTPTSTSTGTFTFTATNTPTSTPVNTSTDTATYTPTSTSTPHCQPHTPIFTSTPTATPMKERCPYPNPVRDDKGIWFDYWSDVPCECKWCVYTISFKKVFEESRSINCPGTAHWDLKDHCGQTVSNGLYYLEVQTPHCREIHKILILR